MRKGLWSAAAVIVLLSVGIVGIGGHEARAADTRVEMGPSSDPLAFDPASITVPVGSTVEWFNNTDLQHDVQAEDGSFGTPGSDLLGKGGKYEFRFSKAGTFKYFCTPHKSSGMVGTVTVTPGGSPTPTTAATTPTTQPAGGATTTTAGGAPTTTTTRAAVGGSPTTATTAAGGATTTTLAPSSTPTSGPEVAAGVTTTTSASESHAEGGEDSAAGAHGSSPDPKTNGVGVALAGVLTLILASISIKLLTAKT
jgi:plastocyanin